MGFNPFAGGGGMSSKDEVARAEIAAIKDGEVLDSFGDVEAALAEKADITDIPTVPITAIQKNGTGITPVSGTVNITVPTTAADVSALPDTTKYAAALSLTINSSTFVMTGQLKDQNGDNLGTAQTIDLPLESVVVNGSYNSQTKKVVLTLQNGNTIEFSVADLVSGLQTELSTSNKLNPAFIEYDSTHRAVSDTEKSTWNSKQNALSSTQLDAVNSGIDSTKVEQIETNKKNILLNRHYGVKNIFIPTAGNLSNPSGFTGTITHNADNSYTINGSTGGDVYYLQLGRIKMPVGTFVLYARPTNKTNIFVYNDGDWADNDDSRYKTFSQPTSQNIFLRIGANQTLENYTIYPMICDLTAWNMSRDYEIGALSNAELTAKEQVNENNILSTAAVGTCETSGNTAAKVVTISESSYTPHKGSIIAVKFKYSNNVTDTESTPITLNVNNSGAYRVWYKNGNYVNAIQGKIFGYAGYYIYYMFDGVDRWIWVNYCMDNTYTSMTQQEASKGTATNERLISARVLSNTIDEKLQPVETNISTDEAALVELVDGGAKNRWKITIPDALPTGFTATIDTDGGLILNGTTGSSALTFTTLTQFHVGETVVLSGCPAGGSDESYRIDILRGVNSNYCYGDPVIASNFTETSYSVRIRIAANYTCNNLKFSPMVCTLAAWKISQSFQPYRPSYQELYERVVALEQANGITRSIQAAPTSTDNEEDMR